MRSFANAVLCRLLDLDIKYIQIFTRDEKGQDDMRRKYVEVDLVNFYSMIERA